MMISLNLRGFIKHIMFRQLLSCHTGSGAVSYSLTWVGRGVVILIVIIVQALQSAAAD